MCVCVCLCEKTNTVFTAYDYVELTREVLNDEDIDHDVDVPAYDSRKENNKSIPLMDARMFGGQHHASSQ